MSSLCLDCGLCCNGVLFDLVKLQPGDNARALGALGLKIKKREHFPQPCSALHGVTCQIYESRPTRCRLFECRQFKLVAEGSITESEARARIDDVRDRVKKLESLLTQHPDDNPRKALQQRVAKVLLESDNAVLQTGWNELQALLDEHFRV